MSLTKFTNTGTEGPDPSVYDTIKFNYDCSLSGEPLKRKRFHVLGLVHLPVSRHFTACAFTQKVVRMCLMLRSMGHYVFLYSCEGADKDLYDTLVTTHSLCDLRTDFGDNPDEHPDINNPDPTDLGYPWRQLTFRTDFSGPKPSTHAFWGSCIAKIGRSKKPDDFLLMSMGGLHMPIANAVGLCLHVEPGIGYFGACAPFRAFESSGVMHYQSGTDAANATPPKREMVDGRFYDRVIPNYYPLETFDVDPNEPDLDDAALNHGKYFLFMARIIHRKGFHVVMQMCQKLGLPLWICGQGYKSWDPETNILILEENNAEVKLASNMRFLGYADDKRKARLMTHAKATFCFSLFTEPFCGVATESQLCGTPVITTNYGAFWDTVEQGKTGFRCDVVNDMVVAISKLDELDRDYIKQRARRLYDMHHVKWQFEKFWTDLYSVYMSTLGLPNTKYGMEEIRPLIAEKVINHWNPITWHLSDASIAALAALKPSDDMNQPTKDIQSLQTVIVDKPSIDVKKCNVQK